MKVARNLVDNFMQMNGLTSTKDKEVIKKQASLRATKDRK